MLDYAPTETPPRHGQDWTISWQGEELPDEGVLLSFIAASKRRVAFEPERVSGFCAGT